MNMEAPKRERQHEPLPGNWPVTLTGPLSAGQDKLQALLTAVFLQEQISKRRQLEQKLNEVHEHLSALIRLQKDIAVTTDVDTAARIASFRALELTPAVSVTIAMLQGTRMLCRAAAGSPAPPVGTALDLREGLLAECIRTGNLQICHDTEADDRVNVAACQALGIRSLVAVPITSPAGVQGLLAAFAALPRGFDKDHVSLLESIAGMLSMRASLQSAKAQVIPQPVVPPQRLSPEMAETLLARSAPPPRNWTAGILKFGAGALVLLAIAAVSLRGFIRRDSGQPPSTREIAASPAPQDQAEHTVLPPAPQAQSPRPGPPAEAMKPVSLPSIDSLRDRADHGDAEAQFDLGVKYAAGSDVRADDKEAAKWIASAAGQGNVKAEQMLGDFYLLGRGVPKDLVKAYAWSSKAAAAGDEAGKRRMNILKTMLSPQQTKTAEKLAAQPSARR